MEERMARRVIILGAAGRDFHNFNVCYRQNADVEVVAFTATQIPDIDGRRYPPELAGPRYPHGIPIEDESQLARLIKDLKADLCVFSYSDVPHERVMNLASLCNAAGADFQLLSPARTMIASTKPIVAICASRTGCGKSQTSRKVVRMLKAMGKKVVAVRHPMPYGDLAAQAVQRFARYEDLDFHKVTIEEREEYEPYIAAGLVIYAGVDYEKILRKAEAEADVIIWDGGNNDTPFYTPDVHITVVDPHRPDHAAKFYPGETNVRMADAIVVNKIDSASREQIELCHEINRQLNPEAVVIEAASPLTVENAESIRGKRVLVIEDGPTLTHGGMTYGAGWVAAKRWGAAEIVDPRPFAKGTIHDTFVKYPGTGPILPAMGYSDKQVQDLKDTIEAAPVDLVIIGTPIDLRRLISFDKPALRVGYELQEIGEPTLAAVLEKLAR
ncbi:MAG: GTPase [Candidatus Delongbacteria bacterium]|nr:GTPase [Candidatus Cloacimonadota bacterium]MCB9474699.1 GTPase [Candidatus Delongbacteria bacterium]